MGRPHPHAAAPASERGGYYPGDSDERRPLRKHRPSEQDDPESADSELAPQGLAPLTPANLTRSQQGTRVKKVAAW